MINQQYRTQEKLEESLRPSLFTCFMIRDADLPTSPTNSVMPRFPQLPTFQSCSLAMRVHALLKLLKSFIHHSL